MHLLTTFQQCAVQWVQDMLVVNKAHLQVFLLQGGIRVTEPVISHVVGGRIVLVGTDVFIQRDKVTWRLLTRLDLCRIVHAVIVVRPVPNL